MLASDAMVPATERGGNTAVHGGGLVFCREQHAGWYSVV